MEAVIKYLYMENEDELKPYVNEVFDLAHKYEIHDVQVFNKTFNFLS